MNESQFERLISALDRIADALEGTKKAGVKRVSAPVTFDIPTMRQTILAALPGKLATLDELRAVMNMRTESAQAVSRSVMMCGFERHRASDGIRYAITATPEDIKPGRKLKMPGNMEEKVAEVIAGKYKLTAGKFLGGCYGHANFGEAHIAEVKRLYPGAFTDS